MTKKKIHSDHFDHFAFLAGQILNRVQCSLCPVLNLSFLCLSLPSVTPVLSLCQYATGQRSVTLDLVPRL